MFLIISFRKFRYDAWVLLWIWGVPFIIFSDSWIGSLFLIRFRKCNCFSGSLFRRAFCISETPVTLYRRPLWLKPHGSFMVVFMFLLPLDSFFSDSGVSILPSSGSLIPFCYWAFTERFIEVTVSLDEVTRILPHSLPCLYHFLCRFR